MQIALDHPATPAGSDRLPFFLVGLDESQDVGQQDVAVIVTRDEDQGVAADHAMVAVEHKTSATFGEKDSRTEYIPPGPSWQELYHEERYRADRLEERLASVMILLHETTAERDRWHLQAKKALALFDSIQRNLEKNSRQTQALRRKKRMFGIF